MTVLSSSSSSPSSVQLLLLLFSLLLASLTAQSPGSPPTGTTIYDLLPEYVLPSGLLPDTVKSFSLAENGSFAVELSGPCYIDFEYLVYYEPKISGVVKYGGIEDLKGVKVRRFLIWFDVDAIKVDLPPSEYIYFQVGWITRKLHVDQFQTVHSCKANQGFLESAEEVFDWSI
ncbi:uncharacterized protein LOC103986946 [Musa acuminata AAA Group]|uniref:uncharacterized protein LOC103986946 n=1 Tax=Musa acuminata AAA Group TaxID=214697 RepID=UPI0031E3C20C